MATYTGSIPVALKDYSGNPSTNRFEMKIEYTDVTNEAQNQRTVTAVVYVRAVGADRRGKWEISLQMEPNAAVTLSTGTIVYTLSQGWVEVLRDTRSYSNNSDGTLSIRFKTSGGITSSDYGTLTFSTDQTVAMTTVPRESLIASSTGRITVNGSNQIKITINQRATTAYHKVVWKFGYYSYTANVSGTTAGYAIPMNWLNAIPNAMQGGGTVTLYTYSDANRTNQLGSAVTANFTLVVPDSAKPVLGSGWAAVSPYNTGSGASGFSIYIQNFSQIKYDFDVSKVTTQYGASRADISFTAMGVTTNATPYRSPVIKQSGRIPVVCRVTDSRGLSASETLYIDVLAYTNPSLSGCVLLRSANNGLPTDRTNGEEEGTYLYAYAVANTAPGIGMRINGLKLGYKRSGTSAYTYVDMTSGTAKVVGDISSSYTYDAIIVVTDNCGVTFSYSAVIPHANPTVNCLAGGGGMGIGAYATDYGVLRVGWQIYPEKHIRFRNQWTGVEWYDADGNYYVWCAASDVPELRLLVRPNGATDFIDAIRINGGTGKVTIRQ